MNILKLNEGWVLFSDPGQTARKSMLLKLVDGRPHFLLSDIVRIAQPADGGVEWDAVPLSYRLGFDASLTEAPDLFKPDTTLSRLVDLGGALRLIDTLPVEVSAEYSCHARLMLAMLLKTLHIKDPLVALP